MDEPFHGPENQREVQVPIKRQEFTATVEKFSLVTMNSFPRIFQARELDYLLQRLITVTWIKMYVFQKKNILESSGTLQKRHEPIILYIPTLLDKKNNLCVI